jgi:hypothetical protein
VDQLFMLDLRHDDPPDQLLIFCSLGFFTVLLAASTLSQIITTAASLLLGISPS